MSKKFFVISTLIFATLISCNLGVPPANAESKRYWTVEELSKLSLEKEAEKNALCHGDSTCEREFFENLQMEDTIENNLLTMFEDHRVLISRINPSKETVHILYHDYDPALRRLGDVRQEPFYEFYLVWLDSYVMDPRFSYSWAWYPPFVDQIRRGTLSEGTHLLIKKDSSLDGLDWITPNREMEFSTYGNELSADYTGVLHFAGVIDWWQPYEGFEYGECLESPDYQPGMECRYVFYEDYTTGYIPFKIEEKSTEEVVVATITATTTEPTISEASTTTTEKVSTSITRVPESNATTITEVMTEPILESTPEPAPQTLASSVEVPLSYKPEKEHEFPWWFVVFIFSGIFLILWWFIPLPKRKKDEKNS